MLDELSVTKQTSTRLIFEQHVTHKQTYPSRSQFNYSARLINNQIRLLDSLDDPSMHEPEICTCKTYNSTWIQEKRVDPTTTIGRSVRRERACVPMAALIAKGRDRTEESPNIRVASNLPSTPSLSLPLTASSKHPHTRIDTPVQSQLRQSNVIKKLPVLLAHRRASVRAHTTADYVAPDYSLTSPWS